MAVKPKRGGGVEAQGAMKRFTIDVSEELHTRIKVQCAQRKVKMADLIRELLEREFPRARGTKAG